MLKNLLKCLKHFLVDINEQRAKTYPIEVIKYKITERRSLSDTINLKT